ncbi:MAG: heme exporter protein CcmB [Pseudomonadota bacterium]
MSASPRFLRATFARDFAIATRSGGGWFYGLLFFALFATLSGLAIGPERASLAIAAPAIAWLATAFALQLASADCFESDFRDGTLRVLAAENESLAPYYVGKLLSLIATIGVPLICVIPVVFLMFGTPASDVSGAAALIIIGMPALLVIVLFAAAIATGLRAAGLLASLIGAPLAAAPLIFGVLSVKSLFERGVFWSPETMLVAALGLFFGVLLPPFSIAALRYGLE